MYQISGELVIILAICSSVINFAISFTAQHFIDATNYGWPFTFFGICVLLSMLMAVPMIVWGKIWRRRCRSRYEAFLAETGRGSQVTVVIDLWTFRSGYGVFGAMRLPVLDYTMIE